MGLVKMLKRAMVISMEDQISYCNKTIQVGPHILLVTCATLDASVPRLQKKYREWTLEHGGHTIWRCTPSMCSYLVASKVAEGCRVLELGAGMGVCGLMAHKTGASVVVMTDGDPSATKYLRENIVTNIGSTGECKMDEAKIEAEEGDERPAHARILRWGDVEGVKDMMEVLETGHFDLVIGSDLIYPESPQKKQALPAMDAKIDHLFVTAAAALRERGTFLLAHEIRTDMKNVLELMKKHAIANGFGTPQTVRIEEGPERVVLSLTYSGKAEQQYSSEKSGDFDDAAQGWQDLGSVLEATGFGNASKKSLI